LLFIPGVDVALENVLLPGSRSSGSGQRPLALPVARSYWQTLSEDGRLSDDFRQIARANVAQLAG
jgi:hypothetical protein